VPFCAYCGREISEQALTCPACGHPNESRTAIPEVEFIAADPNAVREYAGFWIRLGSLLIDLILIGLISAVLGRVNVGSVHTGPVHIGERDVVFVFNPFRILVLFAYPWLMIGLAHGQTVGMMAFGLRIARPDGEPVGVDRSAARAAMGFLSGLLLTLGYLWSLWDREHRTWHDIVADTRVYKVRR
jgi:uncharacterized RDD family membrane protein YckC